MAAEKFITLNNGVMQQKSANDTSAGVGDAGKLIALNSTGKLDETLLPSGIGADTFVAAASEALAAGDFVNIWEDTGTVKIRKANATDATKKADGFVKAGVSSGSNATVYYEGENVLTGLTVGTRYYLSAATGGGFTATAPSTSGNVVQYLGTARSTTVLRFEVESAITILA